MKITTPILSLLIITNLFSTDEGIVDKTHKTVVTALEDNVNELPNSLQDTAKSLVKNIDEDGKKVNFLFKLTNIQFIHEHNREESNENQPSVGGVEAKQKNTLLGTIGVSFLPNTWKINLSYSGTIGENLLYESNNKIDSNVNSYIIDDGKQDLQWINFYTKPLSTKFGDFGFGYTSIMLSDIFQTEDAVKILDYSNTANNGALKSSDELIQHKSKVEQFYITYNIPSKKSWYNGLGLSYMYEKSNQMQLVENGSIVFKPDGTTNIITIGINKTMDEVNPGFSFKSLNYGYGKSIYKYYNYNTSTNDSSKVDTTSLSAELIYMIKPRKNKKFYASIKGAQRNDENTTRMEVVIETGLIF